MITKHINIILTGEIQNIGFTFQVMRAADKFHINGYAVYFNTNTVKIEAEGKENDLSEFADWIKHGDHGAKIAEFKIEEEQVRGLQDFSISSLPPSKSAFTNEILMQRNRDLEKKGNKNKP